VSPSISDQRAHDESIVTPIVCQPADIDKWKHLLANVEAVIDTTAIFGSEEGVEVFNLVTKAVKAVRPTYAVKLTYVETSGTWVHGDNRDEIVTDTTPTATPHPFAAWQAVHERNVVGSTLLNGIVIRPVWVIGRSGSRLGSMLFPSAHAGEVMGIGTPGGRYATIHQDDLADAYLRAVERGSIVGGSIFDITNEFTESVDDVLATLCKVSGAKGYKYREPANRKDLFPKTWCQPDLGAYWLFVAFEIASCSTMRIRPYLARTLLGWSPRKPGLVDGMESYYAAWKASQGL
jgi:nucleoside-diphosphate-sugar epimerase